MSENKDTSKSTKFGTITSLVNNPLATDPNESEQPESKPNEILTNIIKDSNKTINQENQDFDNENSQEKRHDLINDLKSESIIPDDQHFLPRKSLTSGHLTDNQESTSIPIIDDSSTENPSQSLIRSMSESILNDQHDTTEYTPTLPIQQDESSTEDDDDDDDDENSNRTPKQNDFDEKRVPSSNKTDTNRANEEVANISRRTSHSKSPLNRPQSPTTEDSQKTSVNTELPNAIISPPSRRESTNKSDQQKTSESLKLNENSYQSSTNDFQPTNEQSKLIKSGEQLQIPINDINNERINSPPPSPSTTQQINTKNPLLENNRQDHSRPSSQINRKTPTETSINNEKLIEGDIVSSKSRRSSNASQQQSSKENNLLDEKSLNKKDNSRRSSTDNDVSLRTSANKITDQTVLNPIRINSNKSQTKHSSITDSENEKLNNSKLPQVHSSSQVTTPTGDKQTNQETKQIPIQTTDDEIPSSRPQSPNVEQIAERNPPLSSNKKKKEQKRSLRRSNSFESLNYIPLVDDKSLDSTSGNNTETEKFKQRRVKSKKKDMETNTDTKTSSRNGNYQQQQQQESTSQKSKKSMPDDSPSTCRRLPTKEVNLTTPETEPEQKVRRSIKKTKDLNEDNDPVNVNVTVLVKNLNNKDDDNNNKTSKTKSKSIIDHERQTQSDSEQIINEKQKKRRRPKRISRTTQTYECVFRRMEREQHEELRPISDLDKNMQTKKSHLRPRTRSPRRHYPIHLSTDAFKVEEILPKQFPHTSFRNQSKTSIIARSNSPQNGKLLILRPTLPFHHTDAVNVQRISLQYAIDLIPNKSSQQKQLEQTNTNLPMIRSSSNTPTNRSSIKDKGVTNKHEDHLHQRKDGGYN